MRRRWTTYPAKPIQFCSTVDPYIAGHHAKRDGYFFQPTGTVGRGEAFEGYPGFAAAGPVSSSRPLRHRFRD